MINSSKVIVTVVGVGYVGLPVVCLCASRKEFIEKVYGFDIDNNKIDLLRKGLCPIEDGLLKKEFEKAKNFAEFTSKPEESISNSDVVIVSVPTPVDINNHPNLEPLKSACETVARHLKKSALIVVESTIFPGTMEEVVLPLFIEAGLSEEDFYLAHCPERIDPGNKKHTIDKIPRVVGGINERSAEKAEEFYSKILGLNVLKLNSAKAAEATKIMENTFRDVNIAFINEMAKSFDKAGIDILEVIRGASTKPFAFMPHYPGVGVGGHCISTDPYYLISKAKQIGFNHDFLILARKINESMPSYTVGLLEQELKKLNRKLNQNIGIENSRIGILGVAYKGNVDDTRESPALEVIRLLKEKKAEVFVFDPYVKRESNTESVNDLLGKSDYVILATNHNEFKGIESDFKANGIKIVIDGKNFLDKEKIKSFGILYRGIGR